MPNDSETILDIIRADYHVIVVCKHYLGSINHSLMTIQLLQHHGYKVSIIFVGEDTPTTETIIQSLTQVKVIGRVAVEEKIDKAMVSKYACQFNAALNEL